MWWVVLVIIAVLLVLVLLGWLWQRRQQTQAVPPGGGTAGSATGVTSAAEGGYAPPTTPPPMQGDELPPPDFAAATAPAIDTAGPTGTTDTAGPTDASTVTESDATRERGQPAAAFTDTGEATGTSDVDTASDVSAAPAEAPYVPGSAAPSADGSGPAGYEIKGDADSMLYHAPESPYYRRTKAAVWFDSESSAEAAGFTRWDRRNQSGGGTAPSSVADPGAATDTTTGADVRATPDAGTGGSETGTNSTTSGSDAEGGSGEDTGGVQTFTTLPAGAFGPGSAEPAADGSGPAGYEIKGNAESMIYHTPESPYYRRTKAAVWFDSESSAETAGFTRWDRRNQSGG